MDGNICNLLKKKHYYSKSEKGTFKKYTFLNGNILKINSVF